MLHNIQPSTEVHSFLSSVLVVESRDRFGWKDLIKHPVFSLVQKRLSS